MLGSIGSCASGLTPVDRAAVDVPSRWGPPCFWWLPWALPWLIPGVCAGMSMGGPSPTLTFATSAPLDRRCAGRPARPALPLEAVEEPPHLLPHLAAPREPLPGGADHGHEAVTLVDGDDEMLAGAAGAVDQKCLDVGLHLAQHGIGLLEA